MRGAAVAAVPVSGTPTRPLPTRPMSIQPAPVRWVLARTLPGLLLLAVLAGAVGLGPAGLLVGAGCLLGTNALLVAALNRDAAARGRAGNRGLSPANRITLVRATLVAAVTALVTDSFSDPIDRPVLVALAAIVLALDAVDGRVARRTGSSELGARFDMETDAWLIAVLSCYVATEAGAWVLGIGLARYAYLAAEQVLPWLPGPVPPRYWNKVVAAVQGIVLTAVASGQVPPAAAVAALAVALGLLVESFGRQAGWRARLHRQRTASLDGGVGHG